MKPESDVLLETVPCPLCGFSGNKPYYHESRQLGEQTFLFGLNSCSSCGMQFISPRLNQAGLSYLYDKCYSCSTVSGAYNDSPDISVHEYRIFGQYIRSFLPNGGAVLDIGCGTGNLLDEIAGSNIAGQGIELSAYAVSKAKQKGLKVDQKDLIGAGFSGQSFDGVVLLYVLEHVSNPFAMLAEVQRILKPGGYLFLAVPNYNYLRIAYDNPLSKALLRNAASLHPEEHLQNFTPATIRRIIQKAGLSIVRTGLARPLRIGPYHVRFAKAAAFLPVWLLYHLGIHIGGIHLIARKAE